MKTRVTLIISVVLALLVFAACGRTIAAPDGTASGTSGSAYQKITAAEGKALLDNGTDLILVDVRRADEYETAHIPGAINIPNESIETTRPDRLPDLNKAIVVYCRTGVRSKNAAEKLIDMGYTDVRDMGGIVDWTYDTVSGTDTGEYSGTGSESGAASSGITDNPSSKDSAGSDAKQSSSSNDGIGSVSDSSQDSSQNSSSVAKPADSSDSGSESHATSNGIMGNFSADDLNGNSIDQSIFADYELTMVNVWATYCGPCISEMPELGDLADEYQSKGVRIVGLVTDVLNSNGKVNSNQLKTARDIVARTGADYTHIIPSEDLYGILSQITAVPTTFFVDSTGTQVGSTYLGSRSKAAWKSIIDQILEEAQK